MKSQEGERLPGFDHEWNQKRAWIALLLVVPAPSIGVIAVSLTDGAVIGPAVWGLCKGWTVLFPFVWWLKIERGEWSWSPAKNGGLVVGLVSGVALSVAIATGYLIGKGWLERDALKSVMTNAGLGRPGTFLLGAVYWTFLNALLEEIVWRWFVLRQFALILSRKRATWAVIASAAAFSLHHWIAVNTYWGWELASLAAAGVFVGGCVWGWLYQRYRSIWPGYVSHVVADIAVYAIGWQLMFGGS